MRCSRTTSRSATSALAVVDEQHRFGVHQRLALARKGEAVDVLVMTATPIPRTLVLTYFGDMDVSELREKPAGRQPIDTRAVSARAGSTRWSTPSAARSRTGARSTGSARWWRNPRTLDVAAAEERFEALQRALRRDGRPRARPDDAAATRTRAMARLRRGETRILVATTVIEVGVDVPEATVMVIEHAERFGLAQLHQLRGRVGRGTRALDLPAALQGAARRDGARRGSDIMRETEDGFRIAEEDLRLRGEGDVLGTRAVRHARLPHRPHRRCTASCWRPRATTPRWCWHRDPDARQRRAARRCACCSICSSATRRSG